MRFLAKLILLVSLLPTTPALANQAEIQLVEFVKTGASWTVRVRLTHADTGWEHYADGWRVVTPEGKELGLRILHHPHVNEQPFTRSLRNVKIPRDVTIVYVEARDNVHGWSKDRVSVDFTRPNGIRYKVTGR